jgi:hypothetical protein
MKKYFMCGCMKCHPRKIYYNLKDRKLALFFSIWLGTITVVPSGIAAAGSSLSDNMNVSLFSAPPTYQPPGQDGGGGPKMVSPWDVWSYYSAALDDSGSAGGWGPVGEHSVSPWADDFSYLGNPELANKVKPNFFDGVKFIPLDPSKNVYVTFSGEERLKDYYENLPNLGHTPPTNQTRNILRNMYGADIHVTTYFRAFVQLTNAEDFTTQSYVKAGGSPVGGNQRSIIDVQQAFGEFKAQILGAQTGVMAGRQDYSDAPDSMLDIGNATNVHRDWDGFRIYAMWPRIRFDSFDFAGVTLVNKSIFNNFTNFKIHFKGLYTSYALPGYLFSNRNSQLFIDALYWDYATDPSMTVVATKTATNATQSGPGDRDFYGARLWGNVGPLAVDYLGVYQGGYQKIAASSLIRRVSAYGIYTNTIYSLPATTFLKPELGLKLNYFSGGDVRKQSGTIGTYTQVDPGPDYFAYDQYIIGQNAFDVAPAVTLHFTPKVLLEAELPIIWRASLNDDVYGNGVVYKTTLGSGRYIGLMPLTQVRIKLTDNISFLELLTGYVASKMMLKNGNTDSFQALSVIDVKF